MAPGARTSKLLGVALLLAMVASAQSDVRLSVRTKANQSTFHIGELISLELSYSSASPDEYWITNRNYDRSGRLGIEKFQIAPAVGWDDPLKLYFRSGAFIGGGISSSQKLAPQPVVIHRDLNEWVRFREPGRYRVVVVSSRAMRIRSDASIEPVELRSNELWLTIVPASPEWQQQTLEKALTVLAKRRPESVLASDNPVNEAVAMLRYLGTPAAAQEMASRLNERDISFQFLLGLASTPAREAALQKLDEFLNAPGFPVNREFLDAISLVALPAEEIAGRPQENLKMKTRFRNELLMALANKRGQALAVSASTILEEAAIYSNELPDDDRRRLTEYLVTGFDYLPLQTQTELLSYRWNVLDKEAMRPLLPKLASRYKDFPELREIHAYGSNQLSAIALKRWWEVDPDGARPAIIQEIVRPKPRFGAEILGMLPDKELPEVERPLTDRLTRGAGNEEQVASLISRYATESIEPEINAYLDSRIGKLACAIQTPLLAYMLRIDPSAARPWIEKAMAARGPAYSACNHTLLVEVAALHDDPALQDLAIAGLDDSDPEVVANAAAYLKSYGSARAEPALWARLIAWSGRWKGHKAELRYVPGKELDSVNQASAGESLTSALACAQGWLTDEMKLNRLIELAAGDEQRRRAMQFLSLWNARPRQIHFAPIGKGQFDIAQYHASSFDAAIEKLRQFPRGSVFIWIGDSRQPTAEKAFADISKALTIRGITIQRQSNAGNLPNHQ